jgi:hypothetical protein
MTDPITALRDFPPPATDFDAAATHARIDELARRGRRRRRAPLLAFAATAAAATAVVLTTGGSPATTRPQAATAATVLRQLADRAGEQDPVRLGAGEYLYVRTVQRDAANHEKALDLRYWVDAEGKGREVAILDGKKTRDTWLGAPYPGFPPGEEAPALSTLPTEPAALAARMRELAEPLREPGETASPTAREYLRVATLMVADHRTTPPEVLRAIFSFLSGLPDIRLVGDVVDPIGRPGKAVAVDGDPDRHEGLGIELIVNPDTGKPLAFVHYQGGDVNRPWLEMTRTEAVVRGMR